MQMKTKSIMSSALFLVVVVVFGVQMLIINCRHERITYCSVHNAGGGGLFSIL